MPALPPVAGGLSAVINYRDSASSHNTINKLHFLYTGSAAASADLTSFAQALFNLFKTNWMAQAISSVTLNSVTVTDLASTTGLEVNYAAGGGQGLISTSGTPSNAAILVNFKVLRRYRGGKPKMFLPGAIATGAPGGDAPIAAQVSAAQATATALNSSGTGNALNAYGALSVAHQASVSYYSGFVNYTKTSGREASRPQLRGTPVTDTIIGFSVSTMFGSQRRRRLAS